MSRRLVPLALGIGAALTLVACGSSGGHPQTSPPDQPTSSPPSTSAPATASQTVALNTPPASTGAPGPVKAMAVGKTITDSALGNKIVILSYVSDYQPSPAAKQKYTALADEKVVLVKVTVTAGRKYYGSVGSDDFRLTGTENGIDESPTTILDAEVAKAGYPPLKDAETGKTSTGWIVFTPQSTLSKLVFRYVRLAYKGSDGTDIPAKNIDVALT